MYKREKSGLRKQEKSTTQTHKAEQPDEDELMGHFPASLLS